MRVYIAGLKETQDALRQLLPDAKARGVMRKVLRQRAKPIAEAAAARAPVGPGDHQNLRRSIQVSGTLTRSQKQDHRKRDPNDVDVFVGASTRYTKGINAYAHLIEFGWSEHGPIPYMRPAWDSARSSVLKDVGEDMFAEIKKSVERAARKAMRAAGRS